MDKYIFVSYETDGEPKIEYLTSKEIKERTKNMDEHDYAILAGKVIKDFTQKDIFYTHN